MTTTACDLTIVNPRKNPFRIGSGINQRCIVEDKLGIVYDQVGSGVVATYVATSLIASGSYNSFGASGTFNVSVSRNATGTWAISVVLTGPGAQYNKTLTANGQQTSLNPPTLTFKDTESSATVVMAQNNGSFFTDGKIEFTPSWTPVSLFLDANVR